MLDIVQKFAVFDATSLLRAETNVWECEPLERVHDAKYVPGHELVPLLCGRKISSAKQISDYKCAHQSTLP